MTIMPFSSTPTTRSFKYGQTLHVCQRHSQDQEGSSDPPHMILLPPHPFVESRLMRVCEPDFALRCHVRDDDDYMLTNTMGVAAPELQWEFLVRHIRDRS